MERIQYCSAQLATWNKVHFGSVRKRILEAEQKLARLVQANSTNLRQAEHTITRREVDCWLEREEKMWRQRYKITWLKDGDQNTRYFHNNASLRHKKNQIDQVQDEEGRWHTEGNRDQVIIDQFDHLFSSSSHEPDFTFLDHVPHSVDENMLWSLNADFTKEEIFLALKQMHPTKAPSPDGMTPIFYQKYWDAIGLDVTDAVLTALRSGTIPPLLNHTFITLIPKKKNT